MKYIIDDPSFNQENNVLEIQGGHTIFLIGPNTVGKSTLLESLCFNWGGKEKISSKVDFILTKEILFKSLN